ncbi:MAG: FAD-dependent oxidoreductase [Bacilli bacterium]
MKNENKRNKIVIVGGVAVGAGAAAKIRRMDESAEIIVIERGPHVSFANCGLPYYLGDVISNREALLLHTPATLLARFQIEVRTRQEVMGIDRKNKTVTIGNLEDGTSYGESYDKLVLAMGARPILPRLPGIQLPGIFQLRTIPDVDDMKSWIAAHGVRHVAVIGAGFIGIETVENLTALGLSVTLIEKAPQVLPPFDEEMTAHVREELTRLHVNTVLGDGISEFHGTDRATEVVLESGRIVRADMFILGLGVRPNSALAQEAGLELGVAGAVKVNEHLQTSDPDIYAAGDVAEVAYMINGNQRFVPLAGSANKQARIIGENIGGAKVKFEGTLGTAIVKLGETTLAMTGVTEKTAKANGMSHVVSYNTAGHHAGYYPGATDLTIKLLVEPLTELILGAQISGKLGVDKRIDVFATAIASHLTLDDVTGLDLAYAPPFSSAKDPVIMAAMVAQHVVREEVRTVRTMEDIRQLNALILDVRTETESAKDALSGAVNIPLDQLRDRAHELDKNITWVVYCRSGQRSYYAYQILAGLGFNSVYNLEGGMIVQGMIQQVEDFDKVGSAVS